MRVVISSPYCLQDQPIGTQIRQMSALDLDMDDNKVVYSLRTEDTSAAALTIEPYTGVISTILPLDQLEGQTVRSTIYGESVHMTHHIACSYFKVLLVN